MKTILIRLLPAIFIVAGILEVCGQNSNIGGFGNSVSDYQKPEVKENMFPEPSEGSKDKTSPDILILQPTFIDNHYFTTESRLLLKGHAVDDRGIEHISVQGEHAFFNNKGEFLHELELKKGKNKVRIIAYDSSNNKHDLTLVIERVEDTVLLRENNVERLDPETSDYINAQLKIRKNYALIIGVENYDESNINDLDNPLNDAARLMGILLRKYTFDKSDITFLKNPTRTEIIKAFDKIAREVTPNDNVLIFYAGHGLWDEQLKKGFWLPRNASQDDRSAWFSNSDLRDYIGGINSKHTLLIADACFSGSIFKTRDAFPVHTTTATLEMFNLPSRKAMTSGAMKTVPDKSVFMEYLLKRLEQNDSPYISAEQLFSSFKIAVINNSPNGQVPQYGDIKEAGDEGGDFIFILK